MSEGGQKPYDPATWQPEDGDPFKGDRYDRANRAFRDSAEDQFGRRRRRSAGGFLLSWLWHYFFPAPRR